MIDRAFVSPFVSQLILCGTYAVPMCIPSYLLLGLLCQLKGGSAPLCVSDSLMGAVALGCREDLYTQVQGYEKCRISLFSLN